MEPRKSLRAKLRPGAALLTPGVSNALAGRLVEDLGFEAIYLSGAGVTNADWGLPDLGFVGLTEIAQHTMALRQAVALPILVDAENGFGNAVNVHHAVRLLERSGADAIQIEDQVTPKRCGHFAGKDVVSLEEMVEKVRAACDARRDSDLMIIGRTDARSVLGERAAAERAQAMFEAGADMVFVEAPQSQAELLRVPGLTPGLHVANIVIGGRTPALPRESLAAAGFALVLYANAALQGAIVGMRRALRELSSAGMLSESSDLVASFAERQALVRKPFYDDLEARLAGGGGLAGGDAAA